MGSPAASLAPGSPGDPVAKPETTKEVSHSASSSGLLCVQQLSNVYRHTCTPPVETVSYMALDSHLVNELHVYVISEVKVGSYTYSPISVLSHVEELCKTQSYLLYLMKLQGKGI